MVSISDHGEATEGAEETGSIRRNGETETNRGAAPTAAAGGLVA